MKERSDLMSLFLKHGIGSLSDMRHIYDGLQDTVDKVNRSDADFVQRLKDPDRKYIKDWADSNSIATHKLGVEYDNEGNPVIYPNVQNIDGKLVDFTRPPYHSWAGFDSAVERGDTVRVNSIQEGVDFTKHYKDYYPKGHTFGGLSHKYPDGGELKPATITERIGRKWDNFWWQKVRKPKDYSDEEADTPDCARWSNAELRKRGYNIWGDAWTRSNNRAKKIVSGYDGLEKPEEYSYSSYKDYVFEAADNVKRNFDWRDLEEGDIVGLYFRGSPNYQKAFLEGANGEAQTHTGHVVYRKGKPYVAHNVHGDIVLNKAKRLMGRKHPYGIVSVYRPY